MNLDPTSYEKIPYKEVKNGPTKQDILKTASRLHDRHRVNNIKKD